MPIKGGIQSSSDSAAAPGGSLGLFASGNYYVLGDADVTGNATPTLSAEYAYPFICPNVCTLSKLGAEHVTNGSAGAVLRIGIRLPDANGEPGALLLDAGTLAGDAGSGAFKEISSLTQVLPKGLLYVCTVNQVATSVWKAHSAQSNPYHNFNLGSSAPALADTAGVYYHTGQTGALTTWATSGHVAGTSAVRVIAKIT